MANQAIDAKLLSKMFLAGANQLNQKKEWINELNVFPVPDGDTGTNMTMTILAAAKEVDNLHNPTMEELCKAISSGSLRGARGNSGVILSQLFRGFTKVIQNHKEVSQVVISEAFEKAVETAYKAVMKPKEGTILTVAKGVAVKAEELVSQNLTMEEYLVQIIEYGEEVLSKTPDMLPVLKEAGVVDSGGQGLMEILKGGVDVYLGKEIDFTGTFTQSTGEISQITHYNPEDIKFGYCTEFIVMLEKEYNTTLEHEFKSFLTSIGDSIVVVSDDGIVKVHVHTNDPGLAIQRALTYGSLTNMKIDNMREEHQEKLFKESERAAAVEAEKTEKIMEEKEVGFISVSVGSGIKEIFEGLGVDWIIEGGQTMNPSTEDMLTAIEKVNAKHIYIFPNNKNIILAANQAASLTEDKEIIVIPTKTVPQGISAIINFMPDQSIEENKIQMEEEISKVKTGQVTYAVRDTVIDGKEIKLNDIMGIGDHGLLCVGEEIETTALNMIDELIDEESELLSIYYGEDISGEDAKKLEEMLEKKYPEVEVELNYGGQPIYYYIVSVE